MGDRGHILMMSPKGHPELAGMGIEYSWGKAKYEFRRLNNTEPKDLHDNIIAAFGSLDPLRVNRFARKCREYHRASSMVHGLFGNTEASAEQIKFAHATVEAMVKAAHTHRSAADKLWAFTTQD